jgi:hypothetical protein
MFGAGLSLAAALILIVFKKNAYVVVVEQQETAKLNSINATNEQRRRQK